MDIKVFCKLDSAIQMTVTISLSLFPPQWATESKPTEQECTSMCTGTTGSAFARKCN